VDGVLLRVVRVLLARHLEDGGRGALERLERRADHVGDILVNDDDGNVVALGEAVESLFNLGRRCL